MSEGTQGQAARTLDECEALGSLDQLLRVTGAVLGSLEVSTTCSDTMDPLASLMRGRRVVIGLYDADAMDPAAKQREWLLGWQSSPGLKLERLVESGELVEARAFPPGGFPRQWADSCQELEGPVAVAPLLHQGRGLGAVLVERAGEPFSHFELKLLTHAVRQLAGAVSSARLFSELQQSYRKLISAQEQLIRSESQGAVGGLAATLAHEIRNPLATIISSLSQLRKHAKIEGDSATLLEIAEEESLRLNRVIGALLEFARPRMPRIEEMRPDAAVAEVLRLEFQSGEGLENIQIAIRGEPEGMEALADPDLFQRAVQHLMRNAVAAVKPGTGRIEVHWCRLSGQPDSVVVTVQDNGCGISPELQSRVFEPFFSTKPSGIGLGLSVVRRIVEDHGGRVDLFSEPGKGTRVSLVFPGRVTSNIEDKEDPDWPLS